MVEGPRVAQDLKPDSVQEPGVTPRTRRAGLRSQPQQRDLPRGIKDGVHLIEGNEGNWGSQAVDLSPAQGAVVEMRFDEEGMYPIVTHAALNFVGRGALGPFQAGDGGPAVEGGR